MRAYAMISPMFWIRGSGKELRADPSAQLVALYLMTCSAVEMIGIYHVHPETIARETGLSLEEVHKGLARCAEVDVAHYDDEAELVWVPSLAKWQVGESLGAGKNGKPDRRIAGIVRALMTYKGHRFYNSFIAKYGHAYSLHTLGGLDGLENKPLRSPLDGAAERETTFCRDRVLVPDPVLDPAGGVGEVKPVGGSTSLKEKAELAVSESAGDRQTAGLSFGEPCRWPEVRSVLDAYGKLAGTSQDARTSGDSRVGVILRWFAAGYSPDEVNETLRLAWKTEFWKGKPITHILKQTNRLDELRQANVSPSGHKPRTAAEALKAVGL